MSFFDDYKPLRNKIRKYNSKELIYFCIYLLHSLRKKEVKDWEYCPWEVLLILKWVLSEYESIAKDSIDKAVFSDLINNLRSIFEKYSVDALYIEQGNKEIKFLRQCAHQQIWFQRDVVNRRTIASQLKLFLPDRLNENTKINECFQKKTGVSIRSFFQISFIIITKFLDKEKSSAISVSKSDLEFIKKRKIPDNEIDSYFNLLSLSFDKAKDYASEDLKKKQDRLEFQIYEKTPFTFYPFLRENNQFSLISPTLLHYIIRDYVYDYCKSEFKWFGGYFGNVFEEYLKMGLDYSGITYGREDDLKKTYGRNNKLVDFYIEIEDSLVLIEAKATEMPPSVKIKQSNDFLINALTNNLIKAIKQSFDVAKNFKNKKKIYSIIVTYKDLFLGGTNEIWDEFLGEALEDFFTQEDVDRELISKDNIYILSIEEYDLLMYAIKINPDNLLNILDYVTKMENSNNTKKLIFNDHIVNFLGDAIQEYNLPSYLLEDYDRLIEEL